MIHWNEEIIDRVSSAGLGNESILNRSWALFGGHFCRKKPDPRTCLQLSVDLLGSP